MNSDKSPPEPGREPHFSFAELKCLLARIFEGRGTSPAVAEILAANCAGAQRDGCDSHGLFRIPGYLSTLASGWVDGHAVPEVKDAAAVRQRLSVSGRKPADCGPTRSTCPTAALAELLALAVWQVSKWSRHLDGGFAENATGSNWPGTEV